MKKYSALAVPPLPALPAQAVGVRLERHLPWVSAFLHLQPLGAGRGYRAWQGIGSPPREEAVWSQSA